MGNTAEKLKILPLEDLHIKARAKFGAFSGWNMPISYPVGVMKEHLHTRCFSGLFDVSHMQVIAMEGPDIDAFLSFALPLDTTTLFSGQSCYTYMLDEKAGIIDDLMITRLGKDRFIAVVNASNATVDIDEFRCRIANFNCAIRPLNHIVLLSLQGPKAAEIMCSLGFSNEKLTFMHGYEPYDGWLVTRSGYTGEDGFEIALPIDVAHAFTERLLADHRVQWAGLAARDSLRLEAGLCLHGQDITTETNPVEANLTFAIPKSLRGKAGFVGADALSKALITPPVRLRVGLKPNTHQPVRAGSMLFDENGRQIGIVTSGGFGPFFGGPVAMGYVATSCARPGVKLFTNVRGKMIIIAVHSLPFVPQRYFKG
ncbi:MAG: aminomethyltransferase [Candidatus Tokpelaia sp. JSC085]|nr:MAG: aminomethyltransferase [Candidatus Tokpelaia sp. JSC085]